MVFFRLSGDTVGYVVGGCPTLGGGQRLTDKGVCSVCALVGLATELGAMEIIRCPDGGRPRFFAFGNKRTVEIIRYVS